MVWLYDAGIRGVGQHICSNGDWEERNVMRVLAWKVHLPDLANTNTDQCKYKYRLSSTLCVSLLAACILLWPCTDKNISCWLRQVQIQIDANTNTNFVNTNTDWCTNRYGLSWERHYAYPCHLLTLQISKTQKKEQDLFYKQKVHKGWHFFWWWWLKWVQ